MKERKEEEYFPTFLSIGLKDDWFSNIAYFLTYGQCLGHLTGKEKRNLKLKVTKYVIMDDVLYKKGLNGMFLKCIDTD